MHDPTLDDRLTLDNYEHLRTWKHDGFQLDLYDTHTTDRLGKNILAYHLTDTTYSTTPIFAGADFAASPLHATDSNHTIASLLTFLSLRPGDTDPEYFNTYTQRQRNWCTARAEHLAWHAHQLEHTTNYQPHNT